MTQKPDDDLDVLSPELELALGGEKVTVREFSFAQALRAEPLVQPMIEDLRQVFDESEPEDIEYGCIAAVFGRHAEAFLDLVALATGRDRAWVEALGDEDGQLLAMTFWRVNSGFFTRRLVIAEVSSRARAAAAEARAGAKSLPH